MTSYHAWSATKADLYAFIPPLDQFCTILEGENTIGDVPLRWYTYNASSTATDDGENTIRPTLQTGSGRHVKLPTSRANWTQSNSLAADYISNKPILSSVATSGVYSDLSGKPSLATVATSGVYSDLTGKPVSPTINNAVTRPINATTYTISTTQNARVYYTIGIQCTATIGGSSAGGVLLEYSINGGSTYTSVGEVKNSNTVTLAIALNSITIQQVVLSAEVPANALCRMSTTNTGTTTVTYIRGQEILY